MAQGGQEDPMQMQGGGAEEGTRSKGAAAPEEIAARAEALMAAQGGGGGGGAEDLDILLTLAALQGQGFLADACSDPVPQPYILEIVARKPC